MKIDDTLKGISVWCVKVFIDLEGEDKEEEYIFWNMEDVITSINTTWSAKPDSIIVQVHSNMIEVHTSDLLKKPLLIAERRSFGEMIHDKPTHF